MLSVWIIWKFCWTVSHQGHGMHQVAVGERLTCQGVREGKAKHRAILHVGQLQMEQGLFASKQQMGMQLRNEARKHAVAWACI